MMGFLQVTGLMAAVVILLAAVPLTAEGSCIDGSIRLGNATSSYIYGDYFYGGRVEVCYSNTFRPICAQNWTNSDAQVLCNNLDFSSYRGEATGGMVFGLSDEIPVLQNLMCSGSEDRLHNCPGYDLNDVTGECLSGDYQAGVRCIDEPTPTIPCYDGNIRLENSTSYYIYGDYFYGGRVEVCYNGTYCPICDENWTDSDARVVCNDIGYYSYRGEATGGMVFGLSDEIPVLQNLMCNGSEYSLRDCPGYDLNDVTGDYCLSGDYQAGVRCIEVCNDGDFRLSNETYGITSDWYSFYGGTVEVCQDGVYGAICDIGWNREAAQAACDRLGYSHGVGYPTFGSYFGSYNGPILYQNVTCNDSYSCSGVPATDPACNSTGVAGVMCVDEPRPCTDGDVIFANNTYSIFDGYYFIGGRVEICVNGTYRPICNQYWDDKDANTMCNYMGYRSNYRGQTTANGTFGLSDQEPIVVNAACNGTEYGLEQCNGYSIGNAVSDYCQSGLYQAGVRCLEVMTTCFNDGDIQLSTFTYDYDTADFVFSYIARVDYCYNGTLSGICDVGWTEEDAVVACRRYGDGLLSEPRTGLAYGPRIPVIENVACDGSEYLLDQCLTSPPGQVSQECIDSSTRAAGVRCYQVCYDGSVRLVGGEHGAMGRVEVCSNNTWGSVCDLDWDDRDAVAACRSAQFYWGGEAIPNTGFGTSSGPILASNIGCNGSEYDLYVCYNTTEIPSICTHERDAAVSCQAGFIDMLIVDDPGTDLLEGNNVTIWCNAQGYSVANLTSYSWRNSQGDIVPDGKRINITLHNASYSNYYGDFIFNSSLTIFPLLPSDGDQYTCELTLALPQVGVNISNTTVRDIRVAVQQPTVVVGYSTPFVGSPFTANCTVGFSPGVPREAAVVDFLGLNGSPPFDSSTTTQINETHIVIESVVLSVQFDDRLEYVCRAKVDGQYIYTRQDSNASINIMLRPPPCTDGDVIFANYTYSIFDGYYFSGGRVEICVNGTYRPICNQYWDDKDANVMCNYMGYGSNYRGQTTANGTFGLSDQEPIVVNVACNGTEYSLEQCNGYSIGNAVSDYCQSGLYQAGVRCLEVITFCSNDGDIELSTFTYDYYTADFVYSFLARVDYCYNGTLSGICDVGWTEEDAVVACRRYGDGLLSEPRTGLAYGPRIPVIENVMCDGSEYLLDQCLRPPPGQVSQECIDSSTRAAGVRCYQVCYDGSVRLVGGEHGAMGRVEVCSNNTWGSVCDLDWDDRDAVAACRSAQFYWGGEAIANTGFGTSSGPILASNIGCNGNEYDLYMCRNTTEIPSTCTHERDAAVSCQAGFIDMLIVDDPATDLLEGNNVTIWCNAQGYSVANLTSYSWRNSQGDIVPDGKRINITLHNASYSNYYGDFIFNSSLTIFPLLPSDGDQYTCELTLALPQVGVNISNTTVRDIRVAVLPPTVSISYSTPFVPFTANCTVGFSPGVPQEAAVVDFLGLNGSPPFDSSTTTQINETHIVIESVVLSVKFEDRLEYVCRARVDGQYIYTRQDSTASINVLLRPPGQPSVSVTSTTATSISLSWSVPSGSVVTSYEVMWRALSSGDKANDDGGSGTSGSITSTSYTIQELESFTIYNITVTVINEVGIAVSQPIISVTNCRCSQSDSTSTAATAGGVVSVVVVLIVSITVAIVIVILVLSRTGRNSTGPQRKVHMSEPYDLSKTSEEATFSGPDVVHPSTSLNDNPHDFLLGTPSMS